MTVEIRGIRLTLRDFVAADEAAVHAYASDPVVTRFLVWGPNTVEDTHRDVRIRRGLDQCQVVHHTHRLSLR